MALASADRYRKGYLHLFYEDYLNKGNANFNPYSQIWEAKQKIKTIAEAQFSVGIAKSTQKQMLVEELFTLNEDDFSQLRPEDAQNGLKSSAESMGSFDAAINRLQTLVKEGSQDVGAANELMDTIVESIDNILKLGASTGGMAQSAMDIISNENKRVAQVRSMLKYLKWSKNNKKRKQQDILDGLSDILSNISGYMFEIATVYAYICANESALGQMINIGGNNKISNGVVTTIDPHLIEDYKKLQSALAQNNGQQSKVDNMLILNASNGNGNASYTTVYSGFQNKNYTDVSRIKIGNKTLGELGIGNYYSSNFLANTAGGLAGDKYRLAKQAGVTSNYRTHNNDEEGKSGLTQTNVDELWANIKDSMKILGFVDLLVGTKKDNITNKVDYWVIRQKTSGKIRVIPVAEILNNIWQKYIQKPDSAKITFLGGKNSSREKYWTINYQNFVPDEAASSRTEAAIQRSNAAYSKVLQEVIKTKITISVNFNDWF